MDDFTVVTGTCEWHHQPEGQFHWVTGCGHEFVLVEGTPQSCGFVYCPYCGKPITEEQ